MYYHICKHDEDCRPQMPPKADKKEVGFEAMDNSEIYAIVNQVYGDED